MIAKNLI
jgi:hypothetical protein